MTTQITMVQSHKNLRRLLWLLSPLVPLTALFYLWAGHHSGHGIWYWALLIAIYVVVPLGDWLGGLDTSNPQAGEMERMDRDAFYRIIVYAFVPIQIAVVVLGAWIYASTPLAAWEVAGMALSVGTVNGLAFIAAHDLLHKKQPVERWLAKLVLAPTVYGHFFAEHVRGHHKNVATPGDPTSSMMGETFWSYLLRAIVSGVASAWRIERERLAREGRSVWSWSNENLHSWAMTAVMFAALSVWLGPGVLVFLMLQAFYGIVLLEVTNYIEHYGLLRKKLADGSYERCSPAHAWVSNHVVCTLFLYQLQRHADHHIHPSRSYQTLHHHEGTPQLPASYVTLMLVAYLPPLWFRLMDHRVFQHYRGDLTVAHLDPRKRNALLARSYGDEA
ncbi:alkane 1-monooxygenase [Collimonas humicola]|uniref:alkane 1-monooxygenase n=1 Tax=Collimonas humicola TaxID=2825886 RepID=UPI001B8C461E|nr:alkane 1-monooxygenase [Collimonas humicola]